MAEHYYSENPTVEHDERVIEAHFFNKKFKFKTDAGVFSKKKVDFGTTLLLNSFRFPKEANILDLGCGYGPVGIIVASMLVKGQVLSTDINERAIALTKINKVINQSLISENVRLIARQSNGFQKIEESDFNYIILNPPIRAGKETIFNLYEKSYNHLNDTGELWVVIQKKQGAQSTIEKLESIFSIVEIVEKKKGYFIIRSVK